MKKPKSFYEILDGGKWIKVKKAQEQSSGWLHYELKDGTIGLAPKKKWRSGIEFEPFKM